MTAAFRPSASGFRAAAPPLAEDPRARRRDALDALHAARSAFAESTAEIYAAGAAAADADGDLIEDIAARTLAFVVALEPLFDALHVARDQALYQGPVLSRLRSRFDPERLAAIVGEALGEELLSAIAQDLLAAAVRYAAA